MKAGKAPAETPSTYKDTDPLLRATMKSIPPGKHALNMTPLTLSNPNNLMISSTPLSRGDQ